jgi:hypothetical protein
MSYRGNFAAVHVPKHKGVLLSCVVTEAVKDRGLAIIKCIFALLHLPVFSQST